ncbi:retrotransposon gag domain, retroviral aspartyl protease, partial [Tanacetum coccineum]
GKGKVVKGVVKFFLHFSMKTERRLLPRVVDTDEAGVGASHVNGDSVCSGSSTTLSMNRGNVGGECVAGNVSVSQSAVASVIKGGPSKQLKYRFDMNVPQQAAPPCIGSTTVEVQMGNIADTVVVLVGINQKNSDNNNPPDPIATQLAAIAAKLKAIETMKEDIAALKEGDRSGSKGSKNFDGESSWRGRHSYRPYNNIDFPNFSGGDPRGWLLKSKKYFRYYQIPDEEKVEIALMHLEGDALDLYSWLSNGQFIFWEKLVQAFTKNFGPAEFQNLDEFLCSIKQTGMVQEYRQEFAKRSSRVSN